MEAAPPRRFPIQYRRDPRCGIANGHYLLLAVGAPTEGLKYSAHDAKRFAQVMQSLVNIKSENVKLVLNHEATYDGFFSNGPKMACVHD